MPAGPAIRSSSIFVNHHRLTPYIVFSCHVTLLENAGEMTILKRTATAQARLPRTVTEAAPTTGRIRSQSELPK